MARSKIDFDGDALKLMEECYLVSRDAQRPRNNQYKQDYHDYCGYFDVTKRDPDQPNIFIPKLTSTVETKVPVDMRALFSRRPYIPFESKRPEFKQVARHQASYMDELLYRAGLYMKAVNLGKMKTIYGTSFMEVLPYFEDITEKVVVPEIIGGMQVDQHVEEQTIPRLRLALREWAPWEVYVDPFATDLTSPDGCRWLIKFQIASRRQLIKMALKGAYGKDFDVDRLGTERAISGHRRGEHIGLQILGDMGLPDPGDDGDIGILMRFESPERYFDVWDGEVILRDGDNPFKHKRINACRLIHVPDPHTQNRFWGLGEAKRMQILGMALNDFWNMTFRNHQLMNEGMIYYRKDAVDKGALVRTAGNRIAIKASNDRPITDSIYESMGKAMPPDAYAIPQSIEDIIDLVSGQFDVARGERGQTQDTATEVSFLKEAGESRQELNVRLWETFLGDLHYQVAYILDQYSGPDDWMEVLGEQAVQEMMFVNVYDVPGGHNFTFKGSDSVTLRLQRQKNWLTLYELLLNSGSVWPGALSMKMLEVFDEDEPEALKLIISDEQMMQMQQQKQMQEQEQQDEHGQVEHDRGMEKEAMKQSSGAQRYKENSTQQMGRQVSQTQRGGIVPQ